MKSRQRPPQIRIFNEAIIDGFAGGGGTSTGIEMALGRSPDVAINHDPVALAMHEANHPDTEHLVSNIRAIRYESLLPGKRVGLLWLSPDCTFHSKARGGKPFRDPLRARRIRGLAWEAVRAVKALGMRAPRVIMIENVEEWRDWCPLRGDTPDWTRRGENYRRWKRELAKAGRQATGRPYIIEDRELVACDYGSPTKRKRLFVIARCDEQAIVWPEPTHGPGREFPYRTAAECLDFSLPVPSIFLTQREANAWATRMGLPKSSAPRRPLAPATKRRIARGVQRFVLDAPEPFIVNNLTNNVPRPVSEPLATTLTGNHKLLVQPFLSKYHGESRDGDHRSHGLDEPIATLDTSNRFGLVTPMLAPFITEHANASNQRNMPADEPLRTICAQVKGGHFALVAPTLINTRNGERDGQAPRVMDIRAPYPTVTAVGSQGALVAAFLAKHNAGHEATGQRLEKPVDTLTCKDSKALVTSHLVKLRGTGKRKDSQDLREPLPTQTAGGTHYAEVRISLVPRDSLDASYVDRAVQTCAFLVKFFGTGVARPMLEPVGALTTKDRIGLVEVVLLRVGASEFVLADIGMRMLTPRELFLCQGFPQGYEIEHVPSGAPLDLLGRKALQKLTKKAQTRLVGNSVPPHIAAALIAANLAPQNVEAVA